MTVATAELLAIGEVARRAGVSPRTLRYYEELGLVEPSGHSPGGNRRYSEADLARVLRIRELQTVIGFPLERIAVVLSAEDRLDALRAESSQGVSTERRIEMLREAMMLNRQVRAEVDERAAALEAFVAPSMPERRTTVTWPPSSRSSCEPRRLARERDDRSVDHEARPAVVVDERGAVGVDGNELAVVTEQDR